MADLITRKCYSAVKLSALHRSALAFADLINDNNYLFMFPFVFESLFYFSLPYKPCWFNCRFVLFLFCSTYVLISSRSSFASTDFSNGLSSPVLEQCVLEACALVEAGVLREREEREQFESKIERKEREIREQRARKRREREARELEAASCSMWPEQQKAITVPWCACLHGGEEVRCI